MAKRLLGQAMALLANVTNLNGPEPWSIPGPHRVRSRMAPSAVVATTGLGSGSASPGGGWVLVSSGSDNWAR